MTATDTCRVCGSRSHFIFHGVLLNRQVAYFECPTCSYVQTEKPTWLEQAYADAINLSDTGILRRNERNADLVIRLLSLLGCVRGRVVDYAGGYGILVRMLRDRGVQALWEDAYCQNLVARGFEARPQTPADLITAFEVLEHLVMPTADLENLFSRAPNVALTTELIPRPTPRPDSWWYYAPDHGQHIGFFRVATLRYVARRFGRHLSSDGETTHLFTALPLAKWQWHLALRTTAISPLVARLRLHSLTTEDHQWAASQSRLPGRMPASNEP